VIEASAEESATKWAESVTLWKAVESALSELPMGPNLALSGRPWSAERSVSSEMHSVTYSVMTYPPSGMWSVTKCPRSVLMYPLWVPPSSDPTPSAKLSPSITPI